MKIGALFAGIGGLELGLERAGVGHTVWQVEIDPYCRRVLAQHWPDALRFTDLREVGAHNLPPVDVMCGGFPCQDISYAGKGDGLTGSRSGLWHEFARLIGEMGPGYVVVENVSALLARGLDAVLGTLSDLGYDAEWSTLCAFHVGAPHRRERIFIIAWKQALADGHGRRCEGVAQFHRGTPCSPAIGHSLGRYTGGRDGEVGHAASGIHPGWADAVPVRGADGTVRLIPREAARGGPQSALWPVAHGIPGRVARLRTIGNAVVPQCAEVVGRRLMEVATDLATSDVTGSA